MFLINHFQELLLKISEQLLLVTVSTCAAILIGLPIAIIMLYHSRLRAILLSIISIIQTIPSLALLALLLPLLGIGVKPALVALTLYALLPIVRNSYTGLTTINASLIEAAEGIGLTRWQQLYWIELPLALPIIISGIRTAVVINVGVATLAAFIGAGGLGDFINRGLAMNDHRLLLLGAIPAAMMAIMLDFLLGQLKTVLLPKHHKRNFSRLKIAGMVLACAFILMTMIYPFANRLYQPKHTIVHIGSKNFTESYILSELMAQIIKAHTKLSVDLKLNLGSTEICQAAMLKGDLDIYPEYTGTAFLTVLNHSYQSDLSSKRLYQQVKTEYQKRFAILWLAPFGFNNTQAITVRQDFADTHHIKTISQLVPLAKNLRFGAMSEFIQRPDGMPGLVKTYHIHFKSQYEMDQGLLYHAIANHDLDVINAFSTDGRLIAFHLVSLIDDKHLFPPYDAAPLIREAFARQHPQVLEALSPLENLLDSKTMLKLNYQVDVLKQLPHQVAHDFLKTHHLIT